MDKRDGWTLEAQALFDCLTSPDAFHSRIAERNEVAAHLRSLEFPRGVTSFDVHAVHPDRLVRFTPRIHRESF